MASLTSGGSVRRRAVTRGKHTNQILNEEG
jgi:hypothetical protein